MPAECTVGETENKAAFNQLFHVYWCTLTLELWEPSERVVVIGP